MTKTKLTEREEFEQLVYIYKLAPNSERESGAKENLWQWIEKHTQEAYRQGVADTEEKYKDFKDVVNNSHLK